MLESLAPRVEDHQPADVATEALRIARDLAQGFGGRLKQQVVHHALVDERETGERLRKREDDVDVADREQLLLASGHPRSALRSDTSGNADPGSCCTRGPGARTAHSDRDARPARPFGTGR